MTLKELFNKFPTYLLNFERKKVFNNFKSWGLIIYPIILLLTLIIYTTTYNSINNQKNENEENLENFFNSEELVSIKSSFLDSLKSPYIEFNYNIENNDSIGRILKKFRVSDKEIQTIIKGLKQKKLTNILSSC